VRLARSCTVGSIRGSIPLPGPIAGGRVREASRRRSAHSFPAQTYVTWVAARPARIQATTACDYLPQMFDQDQLFGRNTHRVAISNHRIVNLADGQVAFRWNDYARGSKQRTMVLPGDEFLRRFLLHVLPQGFVRIRFFGFLANRRRKQLLPRCRMLLNVVSPPSLPALRAEEAKQPASWLCPYCGGAMVLTWHHLHVLRVRKCSRLIAS
jgi:hypothetical protein